MQSARELEMASELEEARDDEEKEEEEEKGAVDVSSGPLAGEHAS